MTHKCLVTKTIEFDAGHRVPYHESKCKNPHGHRYKVELGVVGPIRPDTFVHSEAGMVIDFGALKDFLQTHVHDKFDHGFIIWEKDRDGLDMFEQTIGHLSWKYEVVPYVPTAENLAHAIFKDAQEYFALSGLLVEYVQVWETPTSTAVYAGDTWTGS